MREVMLHGLFEVCCLERRYATARCDDFIW